MQNHLMILFAWACRTNNFIAWLSPDVFSNFYIGRVNFSDTFFGCNFFRSQNFLLFLLLSTHVIIYLESHLFCQHNAISLFLKLFSSTMQQQEKNRFPQLKQFVFLIIMNPRKRWVEDNEEIPCSGFNYTRLHLKKRSDLLQTISIKKRKETRMKMKMKNASSLKEKWSIAVNKNSRFCYWW